MAFKTDNQVMITFDGLLEPTSFCEFLLHRAARLDLGIDICHVDRDCAEVRVVGQDELIDAFETATVLAPTDCAIDRVSRRCCAPAVASKQ